MREAPLSTGSAVPETEHAHTAQELPRYDQLYNPVLEALRALGGSGTLHEINAKVIELMNLPDDVISLPHNLEQGNQTELEYRLAWVRTYLKKCGFINNSTRGVWSLTKDAEHVSTVDPSEVNRRVRELSKSKNDNDASLTEKGADEELGEFDEETWKSTLHRLLTRELSPNAFERLVQRLLRESGFIQVEVTGRSGDGGIDGKGIAKIHGLMSFHVIFQCKRYSGVVGSSEIRDFRGAMVGRADKGLFITTGTFSRQAVQEATRDGASPIDLSDGDELAEKLKGLGLGVQVEMVEQVTVDSEWFQSL